MKKLIFIRHGIAEEQAFEITDFERSLTPKGKTISKLVARQLLGKERSLGLIITSPAFRALETAIIFSGEFGIEPENIILDSHLYYKMNISYLLGLISSRGGDNDIITLFGHNPSFTEIADSLSKQGCDFLPKSAAICISFNTAKWADVKSHTGKVEFFLKPEKKP